MFNVKEFGNSELLVVYQTPKKTYWEYGTYQADSNNIDYKNYIISKLSDNVRMSVLKDFNKSNG